MASHCRHGQNPFHTASISSATPTTATYCCSSHYSHCCSQPAPLQRLSTDHLLQALSFLLQQQQQQLPSHHNYLSKHRTRKNHHLNLHFQPQNLHIEPQLSGDQQIHSVISSLLQRIDSLESSLQRYFASFASNKHFRPSYSLREAAARIIQTHFRAFLVRRSRTLSQLQNLALIKASFNSLKSSTSNKTHFNCGLLSQKAMDLLLRLDSIQGGDPMIKDGKRSVTRDIVRFLEFIDALAVKRYGSSYRPVKNVGCVRNKDTSRAFSLDIGYGDLSGPQKEVQEKLSDRVENILGFSGLCDNDEEDAELEGFQEFIDDNDDGRSENNKAFNNRKPSILKTRKGVLVKNVGGKPEVKKAVSFVEDGNVYNISSGSSESVLKGDDSFEDGSDSNGDHGENVYSNEIEERKETSEVTESDEVAQDENTTSSQCSDDGERNPTGNLRSEYYELNKYQDKGGSLVFSAPKPVKMESIADLMKKRDALKIVT